MRLLTRPDSAVAVARVLPYGAEVGKLRDRLAVGLVRAEAVEKYILSLDVPGENAVR